MSSKLKIGLIVDGEHVSNHIYELAEWANTTACLNVSHLIIQQRPPRPDARDSVLSSLSREGPRRAATIALWKLKNKLESNSLARSGIVGMRGRTYDVGKVVPAKIRVTPIVSKSGFVHRFSDQDLDNIKQEAFDLLIRCGTGILKGAILTSARLGIVSFHHGDNRINRGGPPGFWEVYDRQPRTGFVVQRLTEELDGGAVIMRGYIPTQETHLLNAAVLFTKSYYHLRTLLLRIGRTGQLPTAEAQTPYCGRLLVSPKYHELGLYLLRQATQVAVKRIRRTLGHHERWGICFAKTYWPGAVLWRGTRIKTPA
ncbi:MAG TPA: hypothetical protein VLV29_03475, partial [Steroidobacteraceae bacterium]|nr:hypothetical protein [Steroidobacteraceae bacterium]